MTRSHAGQTRKHHTRVVLKIAMWDVRLMRKRHRTGHQEPCEARASRYVAGTPIESLEDVAEWPRPYEVTGVQYLDIVPSATNWPSCR